MKLGILGQGVSGIVLALMIKNKFPLEDVTIIDKNMDPGRKLLVTGNGRCNLANKVIGPQSYNNEIVKEMVEKFDYKKVEEFFLSIGIFTRELNDLIYPFSLSARSLLDYLVSYAKEKKIKFINGEPIIDYELKDNKIKVQTSKKNFLFDKFVFASGGSSYPQNGGSSSALNLLEKHKYLVTPLKVGLAPIKTVEATKNVENERVKCKLSLVIDRVPTYEETGEVIFKKDGLSGIAIFNASSMIARNKKFKKATISLDLMPEYDYEALINLLAKLNGLSKNSFLNGIFTKPMSEYIRKVSGVKNLNNYTNSEIKKIALTIKNLTFTYLETYQFKDAQVTVGGLSFSNLETSLESKSEKGIYFIGEMLDADGLCGGYNINFAFASAHHVFKELYK